jgi:hypothetical protein
MIKKISGQKFEFEFEKKKSALKYYPRSKLTFFVVDSLPLIGFPIADNKAFQSLEPIVILFSDVHLAVTSFFAELIHERSLVFE